MQLSEATLLVNAQAMVSMQFFPSRKYTVQLPHNLVVSFWDGGEQGKDQIVSRHMTKSLVIICQ